MYHIRHPGIGMHETARILGVHPNKSTQARQPAIEKVARLLVFDPIGTFVCLLDAMVHVEQELIRERLEESGNPRSPGVAGPSNTPSRRAGTFSLDAR